VVWTDAFQTTIILAGLLTVVIRGTMMVGGFQEVMDIAYRENRFTWTIE
jgi:Na+/proline symporter